MNDTKISTEAIRLNLTSEDFEIYIKESADNGYYIITKNDKKEKTIQKLREYINENRTLKNKDLPKVNQFYKLI